jgi:hypothetical protein
MLSIANECAVCSEKFSLIRPKPSEGVLR